MTSAFVLGGINGFRACYLLKTGDGHDIDQRLRRSTGAEESNRAAAPWIAEALPDLNVAPPQVTAGEAVVNL
jgi:hypothetical protein